MIEIVLSKLGDSTLDMMGQLTKPLTNKPPNKHIQRTLAKSDSNPPDNMLHVKTADSSNSLLNQNPKARWVIMGWPKPQPLVMLQRPKVQKFDYQKPTLKASYQPIFKQLTSTKPFAVDALSYKPAHGLSTINSHSINWKQSHFDGCALRACLLVGYVRV